MGGGYTRLHVVVRGRVQGVGFRWFVREAARRKNLAGWVKNLSDGGVEVAAEGAAGDIAALRSQLSKGPKGATVESLDELNDEPGELSRPFAIIR
jgi:acylphosphatase